MSFAGLLNDADITAALNECKGDSSSYICTPPPPSPLLESVCFEHRCTFLLTAVLISEAGTFNHKKFFSACGMSSKSTEEIEKAFKIIDQDKSDFIEEEELKWDIHMWNRNNSWRALSLTHIHTAEQLMQRCNKLLFRPRRCILTGCGTWRNVDPLWKPRGHTIPECIIVFTLFFYSWYEISIN